MRLLAAAVALLVVCEAPRAQTSVVIENAFPGVTFRAPVELALAPGQAGRVYVVEQGVGGAARIRTVAVGETAVTTFLDPSTRVLAGGERGLLGLAFHPEYETNGRFYTHYTARPDGRSRISEWTRSAADSLVADPASERIVLEVAQPFSNHNAGKIAFGPDGMLYIAMGDGGSGGDPQNNGQTRQALLGKLLRIDVDTRTGTLAYGIPPDNPFVADPDTRDEIYALGLRNPWKFSFDATDGQLWLADVGQGTWEEINMVRAGGNYGWRQVEGPACFVSGCDLDAFDAPVFWYPHNSSTMGGFSVTGGFVYRGTDIPALAGRYLFADFVLPRLWALRSDRGTTTAELLTTSIPDIASINPGPEGEPLVLSYGGTVFRLKAPIVSGEDAAPATPALALRAAGPVPFREATTVEATLAAAGPLRLSLHDVLGREIAVLHDGEAGAGVPVRVGVDGRTLAVGVYLVRLDAGPAGSSVMRVVRAE